MTEANKKPPNFDWVSARQDCSLKEVFEALRLGIREDVETRNSALPDNPDKATLKTAEHGKTIRVYWQDMYQQFDHLFVEFALTAQSLTARDDENLLFEASIGLNDEGDCKVYILGKQYDLWQIRRKALEQLMFKIPR
jgi:hypothetical protein